MKLHTPRIMQTIQALPLRIQPYDWPALTQLFEQHTGRTIYLFFNPELAHEEAGAWFTAPDQNAFYFFLPQHPRFACLREKFLVLVGQMLLGHAPEALSSAQVAQGLAGHLPRRKVRAPRDAEEAELFAFCLGLRLATYEFLYHYQQQAER